MKTSIKGYHVELELEDEEGRSQCEVSKRVMGREYHSSLAALQGTGVLYCDDRSHAVHGDDIDLITEWAEDNGY
jgi:hypothetical protein